MIIRVKTEGMLLMMFAKASKKVKNPLGG